MYSLNVSLLATNIPAAPPGSGQGKMVPLLAFGVIALIVVFMSMQMSRGDGPLSQLRKRWTGYFWGDDVADEVVAVQAPRDSKGKAVEAPKEEKDSGTDESAGGVVRPPTPDWFDPDEVFGPRSN